MYYHIRVKTRRDYYYRYNMIDKDYILQSYVAPFKNNKEVMISGCKLKPQDIDGFSIIPTEQKIEEWVDIVNKTYGFEGYLDYQKEDLFEKSDILDIFDDMYFSVQVDQKTEEERNKFDNKNIFVVYGHNQDMLNDAELFIRKIGYNPIILKYEPNVGRTIIEKLEDTSNVCYAIVLYSKCDKGFDVSKPENVNPRARQNVVFEHGLLIGKLSRQRVCALMQEGIEIPSDINGILYVSYDDNWRQNIVKELINLGMTVNNDWM